MNVHGTITGSLSVNGRLTGTLTSVSRITGELTVPRQIIPMQYEGEYTFTPSEETQVAPTGAHWLAEDITIAPIPTNYGLITWDGHKITVS